MLRDILKAFSDLEKRADEVANAEYERLGSEPAGEDWNGDMGDLAEAAHDKGLAFYETMTALQQATLNLFAAGIFHLIEQQVADLCTDSTSDVPPPSDTKLLVVADWYRHHFDFDLRALPTWNTMDELRLIANAVKHAEGGSAERLRERRPDLFQSPSIRRLFPNEPAPHRPLRLPLGGDDFYITEDDLQRYSQAANEFMADIAKYFDKHGEQYYPLAT